MFQRTIIAVGMNRNRRVFERKSAIKLKEDRLPETYNIDFLLAALILLGAVATHYLRDNRRAHDAKSNMFLIVLIVGFIDIATETITCSVAIEYASSFPIWSLYALNETFLIAQSSILYLFFIYAAILAKRLTRNNRAAIVVASIPYIACVLLVLINPFTNALFDIDPITHAYTTMPGMYSMFVQAGFYGLAALCVTVPQRKSIRRLDFYAIIEFFFVLVFSVVLQGLMHHVQLAGFGIAIGILLFFVSINNPFVIIDPLTGLFENSRFRSYLASLDKKKQGYDIVFVTMDFLRTLNPLISSDLVDESVVMSANNLIKAAGHRPVFRIKPSVLAVATFSRHERKRIMDEMSDFYDQPHNVGDISINLNVHIGYVARLESITDSSEFFEYVEYVVGAAKRSELNLETASHDGLFADFKRKKTVRTCVNDAIRNNLFSTHLQPIYNLRTNTFDSAEALLRLNHPSAGFISPAEFIPIAEEDGRINEIGRAHFKNLCKLWKDQGEHLERLGIKSIKVNVSAVELLEQDLGDFFLRTIDEYGLTPSRFEFEITETAAATYSTKVLCLADRLHNAGSRLAMDDFGSGYANFDSVLSLPFDTVKMDSSLLFKTNDDPRAEKMYRYLLQMLTDLQYHTVCEGVETIEQARKLKSWGARSLQGFWLVRPQPIENLVCMKSLENPAEKLNDTK